MSTPNFLLVSHWSKLIENFQFSPKEYYSMTQEAMKRREIPDIKVSRIQLSESHMFSAKREYLRVTRGDIIIDIGAAPFGTGFFVSARVGIDMRPGCLGMCLGPLYRFFYKPDLYHRIDLVIMYQTAVHSAVLEVMDSIIKDKSLTPLTELERKPVMHGLMGG